MAVALRFYPGSGELEIVARSNGGGAKYDEGFSLSTDQWEPDDPLEIDYMFEDSGGAVKHQPGEIQYREYELANTKSTESSTSSNEEEPQTVDAGEEGRWRQEYNTTRPHSSLNYRLPTPETKQAFHFVPATPTQSEKLAIIQ